MTKIKRMVKNSIKLIRDLKVQKLNSHTKVVSFDIDNMCTNTTTTTWTSIIEEAPTCNGAEYVWYQETNKRIIQPGDRTKVQHISWKYLCKRGWLKNERSYVFSVNGNVLQFLKHREFYDILDECHIISYFHYVDNIL